MMMRKKIRLGFQISHLFGLLFAGSITSGAELTVGVGKMYSVPSQAAAAAQDGDTIKIDAGTYTGDVCAWTKHNLTITGVGGRAHIKANGNAALRKGAWVVSGNNATIENIEFSGAAVSEADGGNGAGIRAEGIDYTLRNCYFHDNQNGILDGTQNAASDVLIEYCEFDHNGATSGVGAGYTHNLYIGHVGTLTFRYNYSHRSNVGHVLKSRALNNYILYNRLMDEEGNGSYTVNIPDGGLAYLIGNLIEQGPNSPNHTIISYGEESSSNPTQHLYLINNTIVNDYAGGTFVFLGGGTTLSRALNNIFLGSGTTFSRPLTVNSNNLVVTSDPGLVNRAGYDYHLAAGSPAIDAGTDPGLSVEGYALLPTLQYVHPSNSEARSLAGTALDIGAYERAGTTPVLQSAVSRLTHGSAGTFDRTLALAGGATVEPRRLSTGNFSIVLTFDKPVTSASATLTGSGSISGAPVASGNNITVNLTSIGNAQTATINLTNIVPTGGGTNGSATLTFKLLQADQNFNSGVTASDVLISKSKLGLTVDATTAPFDVNASGSITAADVLVTKSVLGTTAP